MKAPRAPSWAVVWLPNIVNQATSQHRRQANKKDGTLLFRKRFDFGERSVPPCKHCTTLLAAIYGGSCACIQSGARANWLRPWACRAVGSANGSPVSSRRLLMTSWSCVASRGPPSILQIRDQPPEGLGRTPGQKRDPVLSASR